MSPEKLIKYLLPFFVFAIVSRAIEEISFFYYAVPILCVFFISQILLLMKPSSHSGEIERSEMIPESKLKFVSDSRHTTFAGMTKALVILAKSRIWVGHASDSRQAGMTLFLFFLAGAWFLITSIWSSYPIISASRAIYFILISTGCISAGILWKKFYNQNLLNFLLPANIIVILLCLFSLITNIPSDSWTGGHGKGFMGFFGHQNTLASVLLFTLPGILGFKYEVLSKKPVTINKIVTRFRFAMRNGYKVIFVTVIVFNLLFIILSYSRGVILSILFGVFVFLLINKKWKVIGISTVTLLIASIIILITPSLNNFTSNILKKDFPEFYSSRMWMWEPSFKAAINGGFTGLGYGISDPNIKPGSIGDHYEGNRFVREKGNSSLGLIEETGLIGFILFLLPILLLLKHGCMNEWMHESGSHTIIQSYNHSVILAAVIAFIAHAQFEAWWVGVGSVQLPLFFIYTGLLVNQSFSHSDKITE